MLLLFSAFPVNGFADDVDLVSADSCVPENSFYGMPLLVGHASNVNCKQSYQISRKQLYYAYVGSEELSNTTVSCTMLLKHKKDHINMYAWINGRFTRMPRSAVTDNLGSGWYQHTYEYTIDGDDDDSIYISSMYIYNTYHKDILLNELTCVAKPQFGHERYVLINEEINHSHTITEDTELPSFIMNVTHRQEARLLEDDKVKFLLTKDSGVVDYVGISCSNVSIRYADSSDVGALKASCENYNGVSVPAIENISGRDILSVEYFLDIGFEVSISDEATSDSLNEVFKIVPVFQ